MKLHFLAWVMTLAWAAPVLAQSPAPVSEPSQSEATSGNATLDTIVITGTRTERRLQEVPASMTVLDEQDIERLQPAYVGDELVTTPGVFVHQGEAGSFSQVTIRGVPNRHHNDTFLLMVDGVPNVSADEGADLDGLPVDAIERVEVIKGPMSALYGRGSVAGTLSYFTPDPFTTDSKVGLRVGSYGALKPFATLSHRLSDNAAFMISASADRTDGWADQTKRKAETFFAKVSWLYGQDSSVDVVYTHYHNNQQLGSLVPLAEDGSVIALPRGDRSYNNIADAHSERTNDSLYAIVNQRLSDDWRLKLTGALMQRARNYRNGFWNGYDPQAQTIAMTGYQGHSKPKTGYLDAQFTGEMDAHRFVAGVSHEYMRDHQHDTYEGMPFTFYQQLIDTRTGLAIDPQDFIMEDTLNAKLRSRVVSIYAQDEIDLTPKWRLSLGARYDRFTRKVDYAQTPSTVWGDPSGVTPAARAEGHGSHVSPKAALTYNLAPATTLYASFGEGYTPALGPAWSFRGRPQTLKPEISRGYELGAKGSALDGMLDYSIAVYRLDRRDLIEWVQNSRGDFEYLNVGKQRTQGLEFSTNWRLDAVAKNLTAYFNYAYTRSKWMDKHFVDADSRTAYNFSGNQVPGVPTHQFAVGGAYKLDNGFGVYGGLQYVGSYFIGQPNKAKSKSFALVHAGVTYQMPGTKGVEARLHVSNLFNKRHYYYSGGNDGPTSASVGMPRTVYLTMSYRL